jgi:hypothetical protein
VWGFGVGVELVARGNEGFGVWDFGFRGRFNACGNQSRVFVQCLWELEVLLYGEREGQAGQIPERGLVSRWYTCVFVLCAMLVLSSFP